MGKIINLKTGNKLGSCKEEKDKILNEELTQLANKLSSCDPSKFSKKKDQFNSELFLNLCKQSDEEIELVDDELDSAAGGTIEEKVPNVDSLK